MKTRFRRACVAVAAAAAITTGGIAMGSGVAQAHGTHANPCGGVQIGYNNGNAYYLYTVFGGYDITWNQGWLNVWYQGRPYQVYYPNWSPYGC